MKIAFTIPGQPQGKGRPRITTAGGFARAYTPAKTRDYERQVWRAYREAGGGLLAGMLEIRIAAYREIPKSWPKKKRAECGLHCDTKPDLDNIIKAVLDGLNGVAYEDDRQIVAVQACKRWAVVRDAGVDVVIRVVEN